MSGVWAQEDIDAGLKIPASMQMESETSPPPSPNIYELHGKLRYVEVKFGEVNRKTLDAASRIMLAKAAAQAADLESEGLDWRDLYGVIHAETQWVSRPGASLDGTPNIGLAQFTPQTAKAFGVKDPKDPVQALAGSARLIKEAAQWAAERARMFKIPKHLFQQVIREGVSVYYNLGWVARHRWVPLRTANLPPETRRHIVSVKEGAQIAHNMDRAMQDMTPQEHGDGSTQPPRQNSSSRWMDQARKFLQEHDFTLGFRKKPTEQ